MSSSRTSAFQGLAEFRMATATAPLLQETEAQRQQRIELAMQQAADQGYQRGFLEGRKHAEAEALLDRSNAEAEFQLQTEKHRHDWNLACADRLAAQLERGFSEIAGGLEDVAAAILKPWLEARLYDRAVNEFIAAVKKTSDDAVTVHIEGPQALVARLEKSIARPGVTTAYVEDSRIEVFIDRTVIQANFSEWMVNLEMAAG